MNRINLLLVLGVGLLCLYGCRSAADIYQRRISLTLLEPTRPAKPADGVKVYEYKNAVTEDYDVVALMKAEGYPTEVAKFKKAFQQRAADIGADGLIFKQVNLDEGLGVRISDVAAVRGEAIVFR
ncbi:MAG: hypothetical protein ACPGVU_19715 [Limisphaerales bacterium]